MLVLYALYGIYLHALIFVIMKGRTFYENCIFRCQNNRDDIDLSRFDSLGEVTKYNFTARKKLRNA